VSSERTSHAPRTASTTRPIMTYGRTRRMTSVCRSASSSSSDPSLDRRRHGVRSCLPALRRTGRLTHGRSAQVRWVPSMESMAPSEHA
jgi:hypothetical protein